MATLKAGDVVKIEGEKCNVIQVLVNTFTVSAAKGTAVVQMSDMSFIHDPGMFVGDVVYGINGRRRKK